MSNIIIIRIILLYFRVLAKISLWKYRLRNRDMKIIGVSGSAGKTSVSSLLNSILSSKFKVRYSYKANSETGIPLHIIGFDKMPQRYTAFEWLKYMFLSAFKLLFFWPKYDIYILEMGVDGIDQPKNMQYLLRVVIPDIAIYLNVSSVHSSNYEKFFAKDNSFQALDLKAKRDKLLDLIAQDKNLLVAKAKRAVFLNVFDKRVKDSANLVSKAVDIYYIGKKSLTESLLGYSLPSHFDVTIEAVLGVADYLGVDKSIAWKTLREKFKLEPGRCTIFEGISDSVLIDSSYNSSKEPCMDFLMYLRDYKLSNVADSKKKYRIAVLGEMRELGVLSSIEHQDLADFAIANDIAEEYICIGEDMKKYFLPRLAQSISTDRIHYFDKAGDIGRFLEYRFESLDLSKYIPVVLFKGSQNTIFLEIAIAQLLKNQKDIAKLCRREPHWNAKRAKYI